MLVMWLMALRSLANVNIPQPRRSLFLMPDSQATSGAVISPKIRGVSQFPSWWSRGHRRTCIRKLTPLLIGRFACHFLEGTLEPFMRREVRALSRVRHPNVVQLFGVCLEPRPTVVMAFAEGGTLRDRLAADVSGGGGGSGPLTPPRAVSLLADIARGMTAVHAHDIIHLDLKVRQCRHPWY